PKGAAEIDPELKQRIEELIEELKRQKPRNRVQAERHLEAIGQPAIPFLIPVAKNKSDLVRIAVLRLFHSFGDDQVIEVAIEGLLDDNEYVRDYANRTLKRVSGEDFGFQPNASPRRREVAQRKWLERWDKEKKLHANERKMSKKHQ
ncbi:MAG: HEAT repeat domain-containing protein, partial [Thermoanaerobaculia bacterium]